MMIIEIFMAIILSFLLTFYCLPIIIRIALAKSLFDMPDGSRKIHRTPVPALGGIAIFIGVAITLGVINSFHWEKVNFSNYISSMLMLFFLGLKDDLVEISPFKKLFGQILVALFIIFSEEVRLDNLYGFLGINQIPFFASILFSVLIIVIIINAYNLIDGIDGLAGSVGFFSIFAFGIYFLLNSSLSLTILAFTFSASLIAFLFFNFSPAKIFFGDCGSMQLGLIVSILAIQLIKLAPSSSFIPAVSMPVFVFSTIILPLMDTLRVFCIRLINRRSPFSPDRNHIHHMLLDCNYSHTQIVIQSVFVSIFFSVIGYFVSLNMSTTIGVLLMILLFFCYSLICFLYSKKFKNADFNVVHQIDKRA